MATLSNGLFISGIYADNNSRVGGGTSVDIDGDGNPRGTGFFSFFGNNDAENSDELLRITNDSGTQIDLEGIQIYVNGQVYHTFQNGDVLEPGESADIITFWDDTNVPFPENGLFTDQLFQANGDGTQTFSVTDTKIPDNDLDGFFGSAVGGTSTPTAGGDATIVLYDGNPASPNQGEYYVLTYETDGTPDIDPLTYLPSNPPPRETGFVEANDPTADFFPDAGAFVTIDSDGNPSEGIICFARGTRILTPDGEIAVEDLQVGDLVTTGDGTAKPIAWLNSKTVRLEGPRNAHLRPICILAGALGGSVPSRDLRVSPQHRVYLNDWRADLLFGQMECLVAAKHLLNGATIMVDTDAREVEYFHLMFDRHEVIFAEGALTESFQPGSYIANKGDAETRRELLVLFPELEDKTGKSAFPARHPVLKAYEARALLSL